MIGEQVPNVPMPLFRKDFNQKSLGMGGVPEAPGESKENEVSYLTRNAPYINQSKCVISRTGVGKVYIKDEIPKERTSRTMSINGDFNELCDLGGAANDDDGERDESRHSTGYHSTSNQRPSNLYPVDKDGIKRDMYGKRIKEKRSRWARIGEEVQHMNIQDLYNQMAAVNDVQERIADYE